MKRVFPALFMFFFTAAFILVSMTAVRADMKGNHQQRNIEEKIGRLENRIQQLKGGSGAEDGLSLPRRASVNLENFRTEAAVRLAEFREDTKDIRADMKENAARFLSDAKKFYHAVRKEYFRIKAEMVLERMIEKREEFKNDISADSLVREKFGIFDEKVRKTRHKLRELDRAGTGDWEKARDQAELALTETEIIYKQFN